LLMGHKVIFSLDEAVGFKGDRIMFVDGCLKCMGGLRIPMIYVVMRTRSFYQS